MKKTIITTVAMLTMTAGMAQENSNPWGLVYDDAIVQNEAGKDACSPSVGTIKIIMVTL